MSQKANFCMPTDNKLYCMNEHFNFFYLDDAVLLRMCFFTLVFSLKKKKTYKYAWY